MPIPVAMTGLKKGERRKEDESITGMPFALHLALRNNAHANMKPVRLGVSTWRNREHN